MKLRQYCTTTCENKSIVGSNNLLYISKSKSKLDVGSSIYHSTATRRMLLLVYFTILWQLLYASCTIKSSHNYIPIKVYFLGWLIITCDCMEHDVQFFFIENRSWANKLHFNNIAWAAKLQRYIKYNLKFMMMFYDDSDGYIRIYNNMQSRAAISDTWMNLRC